MNFYFTAAHTLDRMDAKEGSIKGILSTLPQADRKRIAALTIETLKFKPVLLEVIESAQLLKQEKKITSKNLALVLVHDLLFSKGIQAGDGPLKQAILRHKTRLHSELTKLKIKRGVRSDKDLQQTSDARAAQIPRYVRVNVSLWTTAQAIEKFQERGFTLGDPFSSKTAFCVDDHVPDLLLFHPDLQLQEDTLYADGKLILQDKASCMPAVVLDPPVSPQTTVIDATAAPGNKTSHLSALMQNQGRVVAFEKDRKRFRTLEMMLTKARCKNVEAVNADFLTIDPFDPAYASTSHILLDPSCSGSGIVNRMDYLLETEEESDVDRQDRLDKLSAFQVSMCKHAMKFPGVVKIVYSTCSVHAEEDEHVVQRVLNSEEARAGSFVLAPKSAVLPKWPRRGLASEMGGDEDLASSTLRCAPGDDATNGFFVACFVKQNRLDTSEPSGSSNGKRKATEGSEVAQAQAKKKPKRRKRDANQA